jgi:hypothetical protein
MRKLVASTLSFAFFAIVLAGCASAPRSSWSPRTINESTSAPSRLATVACAADACGVGLH